MTLNLREDFMTSPDVSAVIDIFTQRFVYRSGMLRRASVILLWASLWFSAGCNSSSDNRSADAVSDAASSRGTAPAAATADSEATGTAASPAVPAGQKPADQNQPASATPVEFIKPPLTDDEIRAGWISLFDGVSLFGWEVPTQSNWHIHEGCIVADSGERSLLLTPFRFDDFEFRCDFHLAAGGNSGVFLRTSEQPKDPAVDTYELNICDSHPTHGSGSLVGRVIAENAPKVEGAWHTFHVTCDGPRIQVQLDSMPILDFTDTSTNIRKEGRIGLQMNGGRIAFRNVCLRPLGNSELFNGSDLEKWRPVPGSVASFTISDSAIQVSGGPGFLETTDTFDDFILQLESQTNRSAVNSGVFFRAVAGTKEAPSHGYEMQIQNGTLDGDRTRPADSGTGAIFRRIPARYVVANDEEWSSQTLIAQGNQISTWVNGYQVVQWKDTRAPDPNPRRGRRDAAGHVSLQGHDETTDVSFRNLRIHPLHKAAAP
jgi:hypothetical protein